jgi:hypothetical protein
MFLISAADQALGKNILGLTYSFSRCFVLKQWNNI